MDDLDDHHHDDWDDDDPDEEEEEDVEEDEAEEDSHRLRRLEDGAFDGGVVTELSGTKSRAAECDLVRRTQYKFYVFGSSCQSLTLSFSLR
jgi:hypothetical protein